MGLISTLLHYWFYKRPC